tara:strand:- start:68 stop:226 length:159 start_codon:yes stop_codon:yes gene_type:complete
MGETENVRAVFVTRWRLALWAVELAAALFVMAAGADLACELLGVSTWREGAP